MMHLQLPVALRRAAAALALSCSIFLSSTALPESSSAAPIATPTPGAQLQLSAPAPDPAQFDFGPQQVLTHQALNADVYGPWYEFFSLIGALNATGAGAYACGPCITALTNGTGISATLGTQSSGAGVTATIGLSHGDYVDLSSAQTLSNKTISGYVDLSSAQTLSNKTISGYGPLYSSSGALQSQAHEVFGSTSVTVSGCATPNQLCATSTVNFTGAAAFSALPACTASSNSSGIIANAEANSPSQIILGIGVPFSVGTINQTYQLTWSCIGS